MEHRKKGARWGAVDMRRRYVVAHAVWEATSLQVKIAGRGKMVSELSASLANVARGSVSLKTSQSSVGTIKYEREKPIAFGIQVTGIHFEDRIPRLEGAQELRPMLVRSGQQSVEPSAEDPGSGMLLGSPRGNPFVILR
jgi:hypothetical protein